MSGQKTRAPERIVRECRQNAKKKQLNRAGNVPYKSLYCWKFFRRSALQISKSIRRICDGYLPLTGSRHNNGVGVRQRQHEFLQFSIGSLL